MSLCPKYQIPGRENVLAQPEQVSRPGPETMISNRALERGHVHLLGGGEMLSEQSRGRHYGSTVGPCSELWSIYTVPAQALSNGPRLVFDEDVIDRALGSQNA